MTCPPVMVTWVVGVAGSVSSSWAVVAGWVVTPGSGGPLGSLRAVMRICALVMTSGEVLVMVRRMVSSPGVPLV
jgi:hypothetical protein